MITPTGSPLLRLASRASDAALVAMSLALLLVVGAPRASAQIPNAPVMNVTSAIAGSQPVPVTSTTNYAAGLTFTGQRKVVGHLNANMPANTTLRVQLTAASGGTSLGNILLDTTDRDLVIAATQAFFTNVTIRYTFTPVVQAGVIPSQTRTVTFTVLAYP